MEEEQLIEALQFALWRLEAVQHWDRDNIFDALKAIADAMDIKLKPFLAPFFIAIAGSSASISVMDSMNLLGADMSRARLRYAIELLGGVGKKKLKKILKTQRRILLYLSSLKRINHIFPSKFKMLKLISTI